MSINQSIYVTVDALVFLKQEQSRFILLIKRKNEPFKNLWALPGGFVEDGELVVNACQRELQEETGLNINSSQLEFSKYYDKQGRDPRSRTITFAFTAEINEKMEVKGNDDAVEARWFNLQNLPKLAFDHTDIIQDAEKKFIK